MRATAHRKETFRIELLLDSEESFSDDLSAFGHNVGPRTGPFKRTHAEIEDYCLRLLLIAWRKTARLNFPVTVKATDQETPDYLMSMCGEGMVRGLEVTAAGAEEWNKWLSQTERGSEEIAMLPGDGYVGDQPERMAAEEILKALEKKASKWQSTRLLPADTYDLLIYENCERPGLFDYEKMIKVVRDGIAARGGTHPFAKLHVISEPYVFLNIGDNDERECDLGRDYDRDYVAWLEGQAAAARSGQVEALDLPNIAEELKSMGASERRALASHLRNLIVHLLKWRYQPSRRSRSWEQSKVSARVQIADLLDDSPTLAAPKNLSQMIARQYPRARRLAAKEMGIDESRLPSECPFTAKQVLDIDFPKRGVRRKVKSRGDD